MLKTGKEADRWSTSWSARCPAPHPPWLVTDGVDTELGVLKTGKEADVHLLERAVPGTDRRCLLAAKRYRSPEHRRFHRDAGYLEGRRVRRSREMRAMARRTGFGRSLLAQLRPAPDELADLWHQLVEAPLALAGQGLAHGDLSAFNLLVHRGRLVIIDLPQVVDVIGNPGGIEFLHRDALNIGRWFATRGLPPEVGDAEALFARLLGEALG